MPRNPPTREVDLPPQRIVHTAAGAPVVKPPRAVASAFDLAKPAPKAPRKRVVLDAATVKIHRGRAIPPPRRAAQHSTYAAIFARLGAGDMVELPTQAAAGLVSWAKKNGHTVTVRRLGEDLKGVWRNA